MKKHSFTFSLLAALAVGAVTAAPPLFETDFSKKPDSHNFRLTNPARGNVTDGVLRFEAVGAMAQAVMDLAIDRPVRVSFRVRELLAAPSGDFHWGLIFTGGDEVKHRIYSRGATIYNMVTVGGKTITNDALGGGLEPKTGPGAPWLNFELDLYKGRFELNCDRKLVGAGKCEVLPVRQIEIYSMNRNVEFDDFKITPLEMKAAEPGVEQPVFEANFDGTADGRGADGGTIAPTEARSLDFRPGINGQAVYIGNREPRRMLTVGGGWSAADGVLRHDGSNSSSVVLAVPELAEMEIELKARRTGEPERDNHWGFDIFSAGGKSIKLYNRGRLGWYLLINNGPGKKSEHRDLGSELRLPAGKPDASWRNIRVRLASGKLELFVNKRSLAVELPDFLPVDKVNVYSFCSPLELDDLSFSGVGTDGKPFQFRESFDQFKAGGGRPKLAYDLAGKLGEAGALMYWISPDWDGPTYEKEAPTYQILMLDSGEKTLRALDMFFWTWFRADLSKKDSKTRIDMNQRVRPLWFRGDWNHVAFTWNEDGFVTFYINGLPYGARSREYVSGLFFPEVTRLLLGTAEGAWQNADASFEDLKIFRRRVSLEEVNREYRRYMPLDLVLRRGVIDPDREESLPLDIAPGGTFTVPPQLPEFTPARVHAKIDLITTAGDVLASKEYDLDVKEPVRIDFPVGRVAPGLYRLRVGLEGENGRVQRSFEVMSYAPAKPQPAGNEEIRLGAPIYTKKFTDPADPGILKVGDAVAGSVGGSPYVEAGSAKGNRLDIEIPFDRKFLNGKPVMLEIVWPDDKARMMGLYMYPESKVAHHRDRLQGGIQSGREYPSSGRLERTRYLFYPGVKRYQFEARTMATGMPAAVAEVNVYPIEGELPRLAINYPAGRPHRRFGHMDEDQTFETNFNYDDSAELRSAYRGQKLTERVLGYLDYTGQDAWNYPMLRYDYVFYPHEGYSGGLYPFRYNHLSYMVEAFGRRDKSVVGIINLSNLPEISRMDAEKRGEFEQKGMIMKDNSGLPVVNGFFGGNTGTLNFIHPDVRKMFLRHIELIAANEGRQPGFDGFEYWISHYGSWGSLERGYDDYTISRFEKETGIRVPFEGKERFGKRYEFLTGPQREAWIRWRSEKVTEQVRAIREMLDRVNPRLTLFVAYNPASVLEENDAKDAAKQLLEASGLDLRAIAAIPGVEVSPVRNHTHYRWGFHWGKPESMLDFNLYNLAAMRALQPEGRARMCVSYPAYFETFETPPRSEIYAGYFQNADVKPYGSYFLKEFAFNLAALDPLRMLVGAQPIGSIGRDAETREFVKAYAALPAEFFTSAPGSGDPVTVRYLNTPDGSWVYLVSLLWTDTETTLSLSGSGSGKDLSNGEEIDLAQPVTLKPFQLRSFFLPDKQVRVTGVRTAVPESTTGFYRDRIAELRGTVVELEKLKLDCTAEKEQLDRMEKCLASGEYAELHRLLFAPLMNQLGDKFRNLANITEQEKMLAENRFAVNCGGYDYCRAANGTLFLPDRKFSDSARYGYYGNYNNVVRDIEKMVADDRELYRTESYDIDGYKFKVPNGKYTIRFHMKVGYAPKFQPGIFRFSAFAQGRPLFENFDLHAAQEGNFERPVVREFRDIEVTDGMLTLRFTAPTDDTTVRLLNGLEVIPQK